MTVTLQRVAGKLSGEVAAENSKPAKIIKADENDESVTIRFKSENSGYDVDLYIVKKNHDEVTGTIMNDMFGVKGKRAIDNR